MPEKKKTIRSKSHPSRAGRKIPRVNEGSGHKPRGQVIEPHADNACVVRPWGVAVPWVPPSLWAIPSKTIRATTRDAQPPQWIAPTRWDESEPNGTAALPAPLPSKSHPRFSQSDGRERSWNELSSASNLAPGYDKNSPDEAECSGMSQPAAGPTSVSQIFVGPSGGSYCLPCAKGCRNFGRWHCQQGDGRMGKLQRDIGSWMSGALLVANKDQCLPSILNKSTYYTQTALQVEWSERRQKYGTTILCENNFPNVILCSF